MYEFLLEHESDIKKAYKTINKRRKSNLSLAIPNGDNLTPDSFINTEYNKFFIPNQVKIKRLYKILNKRRNNNLSIDSCNRFKTSLVCLIVTLLPQTLNLGLY